jgi:putative intracellular protease/amidase
MKVLMVITSHDQLGNTGRKTGFWLEELAAPYYVFKDAGVEITLASPKGGRPPIDPKSNEPDSRTDLTLRFEKDTAAEAQLDKTLRLDSVRQEDFDTLFYPGGHGPMWDLAEDKHSIKLIESFVAASKLIAIVCHSTGALRHVKTPDGTFLVQGKEVTGFTNGEEEEIGLTKVVPFLVEDEMLKLGATFSKKANWAVHVVSDGLLITGQNPHSSGPAAKTLMAALKQKAKPAAAARASRSNIDRATADLPWMRSPVAVGEALSMRASPMASSRRSTRSRGAVARPVTRTNAWRLQCTQRQRKRRFDSLAHRAPIGGSRSTILR